jgi:hypothetical protein
MSSGSRANQAKPEALPSRSEQKYFRSLCARALGCAGLRAWITMPEIFFCACLIDWQGLKPNPFCGAIGTLRLRSGQAIEVIP